MTLSSDNVKIIRQIADRLEKWSENLSYSTSPGENLWVELTLSLYPQDVQDIVYRLGKIPVKGPNIRKDFEEFSKLVLKIDAWRNQGVYPEDLGEFCARVHLLMKAARNIISVLRTLSGPNESGPSETEAVKEEKSNVAETQEIKKPACALEKKLSTEAMMAYRLHYETGLPIHKVAKKMTAELKLDKALRPWQISRWIKQAENLHKHTRIPIRSIVPEKSGMSKQTAKNDTATQTKV